MRLSQDFSPTWEGLLSGLVDDIDDRVDLLALPPVNQHQPLALPVPAMSFILQPDQAVAVGAEPGTAHRQAVPAQLTARARGQVQVEDRRRPLFTVDAAQAVRLTACSDKDEACNLRGRE